MSDQVIWPQLYSYTITGVDTEDSGLYSCVAGNILGETVHIAHLEVNTASLRGQLQPHQPPENLVLLDTCKILEAISWSDNRRNLDM